MDNIELCSRIETVCRDFVGDGEKLRNAIGAAFMSQQYGWRTGKLTASYRAWKHYQEILGIDFEKEFPEETEIARKSVAYKIWKATGRFWDIQKRRTVTPDNKKYLTPLNA